MLNKDQISLIKYDLTGLGIVGAIGWGIGGIKVAILFVVFGLIGIGMIFGTWKCLARLH